MHLLSSAVFVGSLTAFVTATSVLWDGRALFNLTNADLNSSTGPFLTVVKGSENATHYSALLGHSELPTPLWNDLLLLPREQVISISIDNSSVFVPGSGGPQFGFRRTEFIAANNGDHNDLNPILETGTTVFHVSIKQDPTRPLNVSHEYQIVFIEPSDGSHVFELQLGSPFTDPTGPLPAPGAHSFKVRDHALDVLFETPFAPGAWHNFGVQVDWTQRTLAVLYSAGAAPLAVVVRAAPNLSAAPGAAGQGDFHFGVLKLPLVDPSETAAEQGDVVHFGIQEGTTEALLYSGVFVEDAAHGVSLGYGLSRPAL
ncbi:glycoside hydrolase family 131 protein [Phanerochaete sordida]|uniref:Glycoside hydrolase family 131 protein n=1 Tax=Phanerochaete sordida TaxID=48140 RepID=A0A9P3GD72_9APHY|nr:glycoside hydrolase family 131 protein [Phanerochaete sordida]